jgi:hypothetical protein
MEVIERPRARGGVGEAILVKAGGVSSRAEAPSG